MKKSILKIHHEVLDKKRQVLLDQLLPFVRNDYILGGGTALALQINHRKSFDFDFFSATFLPTNFLESLSSVISISNIAFDSANELTFFTTDEIKVTFLYYPFGNAFPLQTLDNGLKLFGVKDIAIKKAYTIGRRGEYRDYFDLYAILKNKHIDLVELISLTKKIYGSVFEEKIFLTQLIYFEDLRNFDIVPPSRADIPKPEEIKSFFENLVKNFI